MEKNLQPLVFNIGLFNSTFSQAPGQFIIKFAHLKNLVSYIFHNCFVEKAEILL